MVPHELVWLRRVPICGALVLLLGLLLSAAAVSAQGPPPEEILFGPPPTVPSLQVEDPQPVPQDLDPPALCEVPQRGPFGRDVEVLLAPWDSSLVAHQYTPHTGWLAGRSLLRCTASQCSQDTPARPVSDIAAVALSADRVMALWAEYNYEGELAYNTWASFGEWPHGGWGDAQRLDLTPDGNPAIVSMHAQHWAVFARDGGQIKFKHWYQGDLATQWTAVPGITRAASDPAVISKDPRHIALFYRDTVGKIWFQEWDGLDWREHPIPLTPTPNAVYLPLVAGGSSGAASAIEALYAPAPGASTLNLTPEFTPYSLAVASRNANHLALFVVDTERRLWVKEWTIRNAYDWSDTEWVMLRGGNVLIERPAVASRHSNHLGVAVRDIADKPWYIEWTSASGWKAPELLDIYPGGPLTLVAPSSTSMSLFDVEASGVYQRDWTGDAGWGSRELMPGSGEQSPMSMGVATRRLDDVMLLGRFGDGAGAFHHRTSQRMGVEGGPITPAVAMHGYPRGQALAWVDGKVLWVAANQGTGSHWQVDALTLGEGIPETLALSGHPWADWEDRVSLAAGDLDFDGDEEVVVATLATDLSLSVLDFQVSPAQALTATTVITSIPAGAIDVSVAIGDLDGEGRKDEVAVVYRLPGNPASLSVLLYEYQASAEGLVYRGRASVALADPAGDETYDSEIAIGRLHHSHQGEQLILGAGRHQASQPSRYFFWIESFRLTGSDDWSIAQTGNYQLSYNANQAFTAHPYQFALDSGDIDGNGLQEVALTYGNSIWVLEHDGQKLNYAAGTILSLSPGVQRSLAMGDVDRDGLAEVVFAPINSIGSPTILGTMEGRALLVENDLPANPGLGTVLVGDLDNDSFYSELTGCATVLEASVIAVVNGAPRYYADGAPVHDTTVTYAQDETQSGSSAYGTSWSLGSSLSVGFEAEISVPFIGTKIGEVRASVTQEFMSTVGMTQAREQSVTDSDGYEGEGDLLGIVVYNATSYRCFYYDLYSLDAPADKSTAMLCRPLTGETIERARSLESWHSEAFKQQAGLSWVDLGHRSGASVHTNDVTTYPRALTVDPRSLKYVRDPARSPMIVCYDPKAIQQWWSMAEMRGESQESTRSFESNTTVSAGVTVGVATMDTGVTVGFGNESSRSVSWQETLQLGGAINMPADPRFQHGGYEIVPYIYHAKAITLAGATYRYLEVDYYVPHIWPVCPG